MLELGDPDEFDAIIGTLPRIYDADGNPLQCENQDLEVIQKFGK